MIKVKKPVINISYWNNNVYDFISMIMPALKKAGRKKEAKEFILKVRENNYSATKSFEIAKKYIIFKNGKNKLILLKAKGREKWSNSTKLF